MDMDYQALMNEMVVFLAGDNNGTERCVNITIEEDLLVECEEEFNVTLTIITDKPNLVLDQSTTTVSIIDSDGMTFCEPPRSCYNTFISQAEAIFSVPATGSIQEADSPFMACVTLITAENVILDVNITVELNTIDDTGSSNKLH